MGIKKYSGFNSVRSLVNLVLRVSHEHKSLPLQVREELQKKAYQAEANVERQLNRYCRFGYMAVNPEIHVLRPVSVIKDSVEDVKKIWPPNGMHPNWIIIPVFIERNKIPWLKGKD